MRWLVVVAVVGLAVAPSVWAGSWCVDHDASRLGFAATQQGDRFQGQFEEFTATMRFDRDALEQSAFDVQIPTASATTGYAQRDSRLREPAWFHTEQYPQARFRTETIRRVAGEARYEAVAELTIRGNSRRIVLPFEWRIDGAEATMNGRVTLDRTDFGVGQQEWSDCSQVSCDVEVSVELVLQRCDARDE